MEPHNSTSSQLGNSGNTPCQVDSDAHVANTPTPVSTAPEAPVGTKWREREVPEA